MQVVMVFLAIIMVVNAANLQPYNMPNIPGAHHTKTSLTSFTRARKQLESVLDAIDKSPTNVWPCPKVFTASDASMTVTSKFGFKLRGNHTGPILQAAFKRYNEYIFPYPVPELDELVAPILYWLEVHLENPYDEDLQLETDESYKLKVGPGATAVLSAPTVFGVLKGLETFSQLVHYEPELQMYYIHQTDIHDMPRLPYRGVMLDTARRFLTLSSIKQVVDYMSFYKMNALHLHLIDTDSWPLQTDKFPLLAAKTAYASKYHTYSESEMKDLVKYALYRGVRIVPEIDTPSHSWTVCITYPEYCTTYTEKSKGGTTFKKKGLVLDPSNEDMWTFLASLLGDVADIFPSKQFHIGMDEVSFYEWSNSPTIIDFMQANGMTNFDQLWVYYQQRVITMMRSLDKEVIGWNPGLSTYPKNFTGSYAGNDDVTMESWIAWVNKEEDSRKKKLQEANRIEKKLAKLKKSMKMRNELPEDDDDEEGGESLIVQIAQLEKRQRSVANQIVKESNLGTEGHFGRSEQYVDDAVTQKVNQDIKEKEAMLAKHALDAASNTAQDIQQNSGQDAKQNSGQDAKQNSGQDAKQNSGQDAKQNSAQDAKQNIEQISAQKSKQNAKQTADAKATGTEAQQLTGTTNGGQLQIQRVAAAAEQAQKIAQKVAQKQDERYMERMDAENVPKWKQYIANLARHDQNVIVSGEFYVVDPSRPQFTRKWDDMYRIDPLAFPGNKKQKERIKGAELCLWNDAGIVDSANVLMALTPYLAGVAESWWSPIQQDRSCYDVDFPKTTMEPVYSVRMAAQRCRVISRGYPSKPQSGDDIFNFHCIKEYEPKV